MNYTTPTFRFETYAFLLRGQSPMDKAVGRAFKLRFAESGQWCAGSPEAGSSPSGSRLRTIPLNALKVAFELQPHSLK